MDSDNIKKPELNFFSDSKRHLICIPFSVDNLHRMAKLLQIHRCWFHKGKFPHYDIPLKDIKRIQESTIVITTRELLSLIKENMQ